jgi:hypothetical protein
VPLAGERPPRRAPELIDLRDSIPDPADDRV